MAERVPAKRCAIYVRKSSDEGLDMSYNSLEAQSDACAAYIASQRHEGWVKLPKVYEDGGYSGGNMERPGLKQLLGDVAAGKVDIIVVYKIDRLTRSLTDFARLNEVLDQNNVSFVAVTQQFNTSTSMGRLTLNVLLSFAQFEREVAGERIRTRLPPPRRRACGWGDPYPLATPSRTGSWSFCQTRRRSCAACSGASRTPLRASVAEGAGGPRCAIQDAPAEGRPYLGWSCPRPGCCCPHAEEPALCGSGPLPERVASRST